MKASAIAPSNIAFIKYWGKRNEKLRLPANGSISMNLSAMTTTTTVEFSRNYKEDTVIIDKKTAEGIVKSRVMKHLDRVRKLSKINYKAKVVSLNSFPASSGLSSSASAFAALTLAAVSASGLKIDKEELSSLARRASGSACRSIPDGFVEWFAGTTDKTSFAKSIYPPDYWDLRDVVVVVNNREKAISTTKAQENAFANPFFQTRLKMIDKKIGKLKEFLKKKDFAAFGKLIEDEALELHAVMMTGNPSLFFLFPETVLLIRLVRDWRSEGLSVYFTLNTGHNLHLICREKEVPELCKKLKKVDEVKRIIINQPAEGARIIKKHLF